MVREGHYSSSTILVRRMTKYTQKKTYSIVQTKIYTCKIKILPNTKSFTKLKYVPNIKIHTQSKYIHKIQNIYYQNTKYTHKINAVNKIK